jgi:hypothetical protein
MKLAQVALSYGANDLHGTIIEEPIFHSVGATSCPAGPRQEKKSCHRFELFGHLPVKYHAHCGKYDLN